MGTRQMIVVFLIILVGTAITVNAFNWLRTKRRKLTRHEKFVQVQKRFDFYYDFVLTKNTFRKLYGQVGNLSVYNFIESHYISVQIFERSMLGAIGIFVIGLIGFQDLVSACFALAFAAVLLQNNISAKIDDVNFRTIKAMSKLLGSMRETYTRTHSIPDTLSDCDCPEILELQKDKIHKIVTANNGKRLLSQFYEECPNRTMRTLATTCYIRNDTGDDKAEGSPFKDALGLIKDEVDMEERRQIHQRLLFKHIERLPFVPLFLYPVIVFAYGKILAATTAVFDSFWGYLIKLILLTVCLVCYYLLSTINNSSTAAVDDRNDIITDLMRRPAIQRFARTLVPKNYKKQHKIRLDLSGCLSSKTISYLYLEKFIYAIVLAVISVLISIFILIASRASIYRSIQAVTMTSTLKLTASEEKAMREYDANVLAQPEAPDDSDGHITKDISRMVPEAGEMDVSTQVTRIIDKYNTYHSLHFWWWFAFIYIAAAAAGWFIPNALLRLRVSMVKEEATIDVLQLQTVIAVLMDTSLDTMSVVYWLMRSSDIHRNLLADCYNEYPRNSVRALQKLKFNVTIPEFVQICDKLITTVYTISMREAFEDLIKDRAGVLKIREMTQEAELEAKRSKASPIATIPMTVWILLCFAAPIVIVTINSGISLMGKLKGVFG